MDRIAVTVTWLRELVGSVAPYVFLEVVMPGGTLLALLLYLHRRRIQARDRRSGTAEDERQITA